METKNNQAFGKLMNIPNLTGTLFDFRFFIFMADLHLVQLAAFCDKR
jgi:hypothetical protein